MKKWGIVDVDDCCSCARFLVHFIISDSNIIVAFIAIIQATLLYCKVENGKVDEQRLCITGRSAGGYTTLASLAFRDTFKAGASLYGVSSIFSESILLSCYKQTFNRYSMGGAASIFVFLVNNACSLKIVVLDRYHDFYTAHP